MFVSYSKIHSQIVINEIMYAPLEAGNEWYEIHNTGNSAVNLQNWKWKDATSTIRTITSQNINLLPNDYLVICQDTIKFKLLYPLSGGLIIQTLWSALNNSGDNLILIDPSNVRIDSVSYQTTWGGNTGGYSLEKRISNGNSNDASNWGSSIDPMLASPNKQNSITPKPFDLRLKSFVLTPIYPAEGDNIEFDIKIENIGINNAVNFSLNIYRDLNFDSICQSNELLNSNTFSTLNMNDSVKYNYPVNNIDTGLKQYIAKLIYQEDNDTSNNSLINKIYVNSKSSGGGGIVINEIMFDPFTDESEWLEIFNSTGQIINLKGWKYKESSVTVKLSTTDLFLNPGSYFILAQDSTIYNSYPDLKFPKGNQILKFSNNISLTNSGESITITDSLNNVKDAVSYDPKWHNPNFTDTKGISLERLNPSFPSDDHSNWSSCVKPIGGTPGLRNSIFTDKIHSNSEVSVTPNPFSPDGDGFEDFTLINFKVYSSFSQLRVKIFDVKGRIVRTLENNSVSGKEGTIIFNGLDNNNQKLRIGIYIVLINAIDERGGTIDIIKTPLVVAAKL